MGVQRSRWHPQCIAQQHKAILMYDHLARKRPSNVFPPFSAGRAGGVGWYGGGEGKRRRGSAGGATAKLGPGHADRPPLSWAPWLPRPRGPWPEDERDEAWNNVPHADFNTKNVSSKWGGRGTIFHMRVRGRARARGCGENRQGHRESSGLSKVGTGDSCGDSHLLAGGLCRHNSRSREGCRGCLQQWRGRIGQQGGESVNEIQPMRHSWPERVCPAFPKYSS